jgi:hypothetical protein
MTINPVLADLFGTGATQDADTLTIDKVDLGFSPGVQKAESILSAIVRRSIAWYAIAIVDEFGSAIVDEFGSPIELDEEELDINISTSHRYIYRRSRIESVVRVEFLDQST